MQATERVVVIISYLASDQRAHGLTEICDHLKISKTTAHRILSTLQRVKWVSRDPGSRKYKIGPALTEVGLAVLYNLDVRRISLPYLNSLNQTTNETAVLSLRVGFERVFAEQVEGNHEVRMVIELGKKGPLWIGAHGKCILAFMEREETEQVLENFEKSPSKILASGQMLETENLRKELAEIRKNGFSVSLGERVIGAAAVAAPIFSKEGKVLGAVAIIGPQHRFTVDILKQYGSLVRQAGNNISVEMGFVENKQSDRR
jgi:IclR family acetate operon transcriptional repressor